MRNIYISITLVFASLNIFGQSNLYNEFKSRIQKAYAENTFELKFDLTINTIDNHSVKQMGVIKKSDNAFFSQYGDYVSLANNNCKLKVDNQHKLIFYQENSTSDSFDFTSLLQVNIDTSTLSSIEISKNYIKNGLTTYVFDFSKTANMISRMSFTLNENGTLNNVEYSYNSESSLRASVSTVVIKYYDIEIGKQFKPSEFSENAFVNISKGKVEPNRNYGNYSLKTL